MPELPLQRFEEYLLRSGVAPRHVRRSLLEIKDHCEDLYIAALADGVSERAAQRLAVKRIGELNDIAEAIVSRREFRTWAYRYPNLARVCLPLAYAAMLPAVPLYAGIARAPVIARWGACMMLGALVTAAMFLVLQLSIAVA